MKKLFLAIGFAVVLIGLSNSASAQKKPYYYYGNVWIKNFVDITTNGTTTTFGLSVVGDGIDNVLYKDYRLPTSTDPCVGAFGNSFFHMFPQEFSNCQAPNPRSFRLYIPREAFDDANFPQACKTVFQFDSDRNQYFGYPYRVYFSNLYGTTDRKNPVLLTSAKFGIPCGSESYDIQTTQLIRPTILSPDGRKRRVSNYGNSAVPATLFYPQNGSMTPVGVQPFPLWFDITTELTIQ
ncbi:MAG TPA: hypothetical protein VF556_08650 [Pyrinomonadaceae bacterium]|jgi:hypothetical protein